MPKIQMYWSCRVLYYNPVIRNIMPRNQFLLIQRFWHFQIKSAEDSQPNPDRLFMLEQGLQATLQIKTRMHY